MFFAVWDTRFAITEEQFAADVKESIIMIDNNISDFLESKHCPTETKASNNANVRLYEQRSAKKKRKIRKQNRGLLFLNFFVKIYSTM